MNGQTAKADAYVRHIHGLSEYRVGCAQMARWKRRNLLPKCKGCGRHIDGEMRKGYCVWCQSMNKAAKIEIARAENEQRKERLEKERAKFAKKRAKQRGS